jgi:hypothetical protein
VPVELRAYRARLLARRSGVRAVDEARPYRSHFPPVRRIVIDVIALSLPNFGDNVTRFGMGYDLTLWSPLREINKSTSSASPPERRRAGGTVYVFGLMRDAA